MTARIVHPAKFSEPILPVMARYVDGEPFCDIAILDPFAGTGRVAELNRWLCRMDEAQGVYRGPLIVANEIEPAWAKAIRGCDRVIVGDARSLPFEDGRFGAIVTSPAYGNRMADAANWAEGRKHSTYTSALRETIGDPTAVLQAGNAGAEQWGHSYREIHRAAWAEAWRVLTPGGRLVLNIADHYRAGQLQGVPEWHVSALLAQGFVLLDWVEVPTQRYSFGANADKRAPELVILFDRPAPNCPGPTWRYTPTDRRPGHLWDVRPEVAPPQQLSLLGGAS
jgi:SAM-dependent methyltransferase